ncbi:hypothetical protein J4P02_20865 [Pseudomonas sp. NFXW11]|uniref:hypothetical protein n=1 Tax=Pseudomonas sp. NFXW11 TaxID=2819531 RepID=UPI003CF377B0
MRYPFSTCPARYTLGALLLGVTLVAGCRSTPPESPEQRRHHQYVDAVSQVLNQQVRRVNLDGWAGGLTLHALINRRNELVGCSTEALAQYPVQNYPDNRLLASVVQRICWDTVFPRAAPELFSGASQEPLDVRVALVFSRPGRLPPEAQKVRETVREYNAREAFIWRRLFAEERLESIGQARVQGTANAQGQVQGCQVQLTAIPERAADFRPDPELVQRLQSRCAQLDARQLPGFFASETVGDSFLVELQYTPWKGRAEQP